MIISFSHGQIDGSMMFEAFLMVCEAKQWESRRKYREPLLDSSYQVTASDLGTNPRGCEHRASNKIWQVMTGRQGRMTHA